MTDFRRIQQALAEGVRAPAPGGLPVPCPPDRLALYRRLVFNNLAGFLENAFPRVRHALEQERWESLLRRFLAEHACRAPCFHDIPGEFLQWLPESAADWQDLPWLAELAHFEWAQLAADIADGEYPAVRRADWTEGIPVVSPFAWLLAYRWTVHRQGDMAYEPTVLLISRSLRHDVELLLLSPAGAALASRLLDNPDGMHGARILQALAHELGRDAADLRVEVEPLIGRLRERDILLGIRP